MKLRRCDTFSVLKSVLKSVIKKSRSLEIYQPASEPKNQDKESTTEYAKSTRQKRQLLVVFARGFLT
jgi:hypothetical protein